MIDSQTKPELSILVMAHYGVENLPQLLPGLLSTLNELSENYEVIAIAPDATPAVNEQIKANNLTFIASRQLGYGGALRAGFAAASGNFILTLDGEILDDFSFIKTLWASRTRADVVIASRYVQGSKTQMPSLRYILSRSLNMFFSRGLDLRVRDMSSAFRLYNAQVLRQLKLESNDTSILQEILLKTYCDGWSAIEVPFNYHPRPRNDTYREVLSFGVDYLREFNALYRLRNSILSADYDDRAHDSAVPPQRYWQRQRFRHITQLVDGQGATLDVGCGSSRIIRALPKGSIAVDILLRKLRYARKFDKYLAQGSGFSLPFPSEKFPCVLCSQVIEHVPKESPILDELCRVLAPGGRLVLGTPDYANWEWRVTEAIYGKVLPSAYADEHISHYTKQELVELFTRRGYILEDTRYILRGELILAFRKPKS